MREKAAAYEANWGRDGRQNLSEDIWEEVLVSGLQRRHSLTLGRWKIHI